MDRGEHVHVGVRYYEGTEMSEFGKGRRIEKLITHNDDAHYIVLSDDIMK